MRGLTFEPRADGRAQPIEHDDLVMPTPRGPGVRVVLARATGGGRRAVRLVPAIVAFTLAVFVTVEAMPPALTLILIGETAAIAALIKARAVRERRLRAAEATILHLRGELSLCLEQRAEGRERIRQLMLQLNQKDIPA